MKGFDTNKEHEMYGKLYITHTHQSRMLKLSISLARFIYIYEVDLGDNIV